MSRTRTCARIAAAIIAAAGCARAADALPLADRPVAGQAGAAIALAQAQEGEPGGLFHGVGVVTAIDPAGGSLTLDHGEIKGLMPAMEMMYRVDPRSLSEGLRNGDKIEFAVDAQDLHHPRREADRAREVTPRIPSGGGSALEKARASLATLAGPRTRSPLQALRRIEPGLESVSSTPLPSRGASAAEKKQIRLRPAVLAM